jgi:hypothetical protein
MYAIGKEGTLRAIEREHTASFQLPFENSRHGFGMFPASSIILHDRVQLVYTDLKGVQVSLAVHSGFVHVIKKLLCVAVHGGMYDGRWISDMKALTEYGDCHIPVWTQSDCTLLELLCLSQS